MEAAVAGYAEGVLKSSLGKLGSFLLNEALLIGSVRQDIQFIRDELMSMNAVMQDMIHAGPLNQQMRTWMLQVLEVACDAELCTDEFLEKVGARHVHGFSAAALHYARSLPTLLARYQIAKTIQELKSRAKEVSERRSRYTATIAAPNTKKSELTRGTRKRDPLKVWYNNLVPASALLGIDTESDIDVINVMFTRLVFIGPIGSGKTAFARMVFHRWANSWNVVFIRSAWVTVSREPDMKHVLLEILRQVMKKPIQGIEDYDLMSLSDILRDELAHKEYVLVLDSLWSVEHWQIIKAALPENETGSVVITTRNENLAQVCCPDVSGYLIYRMQPLPKEQLYKLFDDLLANVNLDGVYKGVKDVWNEIRDDLVHSSPMPLALKCISGILAGVNIQLGQFYNLTGELKELTKNTTTEDDRTRKVVKYCWRDHLPSSLQQLCSDLSILPEGYAISRKILMRRWIAKDLVSSNRGFSAEETAERYFDELISRCIIEPNSVHPSGKIRTCVINGVFKELILPLLICNTPNPESVNPDNNIQPVQDLESVNHLDNKQMPNPQTSNQDSDPASFQLYNINPPSQLTFVKNWLFLKRPEFLTFIDLEGCKGLSNRELNKLCQFVKLRFLSLRNTDAEHLPEKIGQLNLLETLDIRQTKIEKLPSVIVSLHNLKHLLAGYVYKPERISGTNFVSYSTAVKVPTGINNMQALQTLAHVNATRASEILHALRELTQLRKLGLVINERELNSMPLCITIMMLNALLRSLSVCDEREGRSLDFLDYMCFPPEKLESLKVRGHLKRLPLWVANHKHLTKITLSHTQLGSDDLEMLGKISSMRCLKLYAGSFREDELFFGQNEFKALRVLVVHCDTVQTIHFGEGTACSLEVFKWVLSHNSTCNIIGVEKLPMLRYASFLGSNMDDTFTFNIEQLFQRHENYEKSLFVKFTDKETL